MSKKVVAIILVIFAIVAVAVTGVLISTKVGFNFFSVKDNKTGKDIGTINSGDNLTDDILKIDYTYGITDLNNQYTMNNIEIESLKYSEGKGFKMYSWSTTYDYPVEISYFKISGLKDKKVQEKINNRVKDLAFSMLPSGDAIKKNVTVSEDANFSNILTVSAGYSMYVQRKPGDPNFNYDSDYNKDYFYGNKYITFDLVTGDEITLDDVFVDNYNYKQLIANALYKSLAWDYEYMEWEYDPDTDTYIEPEDTGRADLEDRQFALMHQFDKGNYSFGVSDSYIYVSIENAVVDSLNYESYNDSTRSIYIDMKPYYSEIAIFNRFKTKDSIFEKGDSEDKKYFFIDTYRQRQIHELSDNLFVFYDDEETYRKDYEQQYQEWLNGRINADINYAKKYPNKQLIEIIYHTYDYVGQYPNSAEGYMINILRAELPKSVFDKANGKNEIINIIRNPYEDSEEYWYASEEIADSITKLLKKIDTSGSLDIVKWKNGAYYKNDYSYDTYREIFDYDTFFVLKSDEKVLTEEDVKSLDIEALNTAYNEIFARYGHDFTNKSLRSYFLGQLWYAMVPDKKVTVEELSDVEKINLNFISNRINYLRSGPAQIIEE